MEKDQPTYNLDLSWRTIVRVVFTIALIFLLFVLRNLLVSFIFALVLAVLLKSSIVFFYRRGLPYWAAAVLTYGIVFGLFAVLLYLSIPLIFAEVKNLAVVLPGYLEQVGPFFSSIGFEISAFGEWAQESLLPRAPENILQALSSVMGGLANTGFVILMALFISLEKKGVEGLIAFLAPIRYQKRVVKAWTRSRKQVTHWFATRIISALFVIAAYFLIYQLFGVNAALVLALIAGAANFIPYIGSLAAALIGAGIVALQINWVTAIIVLFILFAIQAAEAYVLTPLLTRRVSGLPPYLILLALAIGGTLFGMVGAFLAIPMTAIIYRFMIDLKQGEYYSEELDSIEPEDIAT